MKRRIAIQGYKGSFHEMAARRFYAPDAVCPIPGGGGIEVVECATFEQLFERVADHRADAAVMAIENTVSGGLLPNFELLRSNSLPVRGETYLRIEQNLMALPGQGIETYKQNFTRFLILDPAIDAGPQRTDKASLCFTLPHKPGSLASILTILSFYEMNLTRIQSLPIPGHEWQYFFYADIRFESYERYRQALAAIRLLMEELRILGEYISAL